MSLHNFVWNSMQIQKLSLFYFLALIVFDFYSLEIYKKDTQKHENRIFLEKYFENEKILTNKKISEFNFTYAVQIRYINKKFPLKNGWSP